MRSRKRRYKFDSPPKETSVIPGISQGVPDPSNPLGISALMKPLETTSFIPATKAEKKLYVSNIPKGITAPAVSLP